MPRSLINLIGVVVMVAVLALGIFLVAVPVGFQALDVVGQTATVANTNAMYQAQVDSLTEQQKQLDDIEASVAGLQTQITPANDLDDVFELVATAAERAGVSITGITAGDAVAFVERTGATTIDETAQAAEAAPAPDAATADPAATPAPTDASTPAAADGAQGAVAADGTAAAPAGRTQVDFSINVTADSIDQVVAFLDELRGGPRLLGQVKTTVSPTGTGFDVTVSALTFVMPKEG
ncbi:hypothetical protein G5T42_16840 [Microbacterium sp. 4R-513]|uniref:hypothetical protein n=1 Tax=Microbacterium sp. 4R-513 TaxID=2567934 RepID=UPI0013E12A14|nr:hypothetical protein [Microbacterium sp. 4R-513]QIG40932.1 hypothetical protein G5T42_16840 [Microbacterium sp. 4R-513]